MHNNGEWPTNGRFVPAGNAVSIAIEASQYKTSKKLRVFAPEDRQCYFDDVSITDEINDEVMHIRGLPYLRANCIVACRRYYLMKYCNCSVDFFYPGESVRDAPVADSHIVTSFRLILDYGYPSCTVTGLQCLSYLNCKLKLRFKNTKRITEFRPFQRSWPLKNRKNRPLISRTLKSASVAIVCPNASASNTDMRWNRTWDGNCLHFELHFQLK